MITKMEEKSKKKKSKEKKSKSTTARRDKTRMNETDSSLTHLEANFQLALDYGGDLRLLHLQQLVASRLEK